MGQLRPVCRPGTCACCRANRIATIPGLGTGGDQAQAEAEYRIAVPVIDRMARKGMIHMNKAARHKSRLIHHIRAMPV